MNEGGMHQPVNLNDSEAWREAHLTSNDEVSKLYEEGIIALRVAKGNDPSFPPGMEVQKMRKSDTDVLVADKNNLDKRHRPGAHLRTYKRGPDGKLKDETYNGESLLPEGAIIYRNSIPVLDMNGEPTRGKYDDETGVFTEDPNGPEILYNEYFTTNPEHTKAKYGLNRDEIAGKGWQKGMARIPSYLIKIPKGIEGEIQVTTSTGNIVTVYGGDSLVVEPIAGKVGHQAIGNQWVDASYKPWKDEV